MYIYVYTHTNVYIYIHVHVHAYIFIYIYVHLYTCVHRYTYMHIFVLMWTKPHLSPPLKTHSHVSVFSLHSSTQNTHPHFWFVVHIHPHQPPVGPTHTYIWRFMYMYILVWTKHKCIFLICGPPFTHNSHFSDASTHPSHQQRRDAVAQQPRTCCAVRIQAQSWITGQPPARRAEGGGGGETGPPSPRFFTPPF